jgi:hypothetical protein
MFLEVLRVIGMNCFSMFLAKVTSSAQLLDHLTRYFNDFSVCLRPSERRPINYR